MKLIKMECPYCGASLEIPEGEKTAKCSYCGKTIEVTPDNENVITIKDEAKLKEAELKEKQYQDEKAEKERNEKKAFKRSKTGKLIIALIVIALLGALVAFMSRDILAGIIALVQIALLTAAMMIGSGSIDKIKGKRIPYIVFLIIACVLCIPYFQTSGSTSTSKKVKKEKEELAWPATELAKRIPEPDSKYGDVSVSDEETLYVDVDDYTEKKYQAYVEKCKEKGFTVDASVSTDSYEAADKDGYVLSLDYYDDSMSINLDAAPEYTEFTWPVSTLASVLPEPPVNRGKVTIDTSTDFDILIPDVDKAKFRDYANAVLNAGFNIDYENSDTYFEGKNADGIEVSLSKRTGNVLDIDLEAPEEATPAPTTEATAAPAATAAAGIRPEFKEAMDSYKATVDAYCDFMKSYDSSNVEMLAKYTKLYAQYMDTMSKLDDIDEQELSDEEDAYYLQIMSEINQELIETGLSMN